MGILSKIKELIKKIKTNITEAKKTVVEFVEEHKEQIAKAMQLADLAYDTFEGSIKMKSVISFFITGINTKCGTSFNAEEIGTEKTKELEDKFQEVYNGLKA